MGKTCQSRRSKRLGRRICIALAEAWIGTALICVLFADFNSVHAQTPEGANAQVGANGQPGTAEQAEPEQADSVPAESGSTAPDDPETEPGPSDDSPGEDPPSGDDSSSEAGETSESGDTTGSSIIRGFAGRTPRKDRTLEYWGAQLSNERFLRRQSAIRHLVDGGQQSVPVLMNLLDGADLETTESVVSILARIGESEQPWHEQGAIAALESMAKRGFGSKAALAESTLKSFAEARRVEAQIRLEEVGVFVGPETVALGSRSRERNVVRIDDGFDGEIRSLSWLRWIGDIDCVVLSGGAVRPEVLEQVHRMPVLDTLIMIDCELTPETMQTMAEGKRVDVMELRYTRLTEPLLKGLAKVRLRDSLFLLGTAVTPERVDQLRLEMPGLEISLRRGGFLGVVCRSTLEDYCEVSEVMPGSGADEAGLQSRDIIIRIDGRKVTRFEDLQKQINTHIPGDKIAIRYRRGIEEFDTQATLQRLNRP